MKVILINPNFTPSRSADAMQPLAFAILKALTPEGVEISFSDERVEPLDVEETGDLVALSVQTFTARRAYAIAQRYRSRGIPVVMGGFHPSLMPDESLRHADSVVIGDAEGVWPEVLRDAARGALRSLYRGDPSAPLGGLFPDRSIFRGKRYSPLLPVQFGRGCCFDCDFCSVKALYGGTMRHRPIEEVTKEIRTSRARYIFFVDDNLFADEQRIEPLLRSLQPLNIRWACQVSLNIARRRDLLRLMEASGCLLVYIGFESFQEQTLRDIGKSSNLGSREYSMAVEQFREFHIMVAGSFIFGYDHDTPESFRQVLDFSRRSKLCLAMFNAPFPTPKTRLYERLKAEGRLVLDDWWLAPEYRYGDVLFRPRAMTAEQLRDGCFEARKRFNTLPSIIRRCIDFKVNAAGLDNLVVFLASNLISRREIYHKQWMRLG